MRKNRINHDLYLPKIFLNRPDSNRKMRSSSTVPCLREYAITNAEVPARVRRNPNHQSPLHQTHSASGLE